MSSVQSRQLIAVFVIAGGVCVGGYELFAAPANQRLAQARQQAQALRTRISHVQRASEAGPILSRRAEECRVAAAAIERLGATARDEAALFAAIEALAAEHQVTVERISPARTRGAATDRRAAADDRAAAVGVELRIRAAFADLVPWVRRLQHGLGICRVESIAIAPDGAEEPGGITAAIRLTVFAIAPEAPAAPAEQQGGRS